MPKVGMQPIRRRQLIDATIRTIEAYGFADTTIARISRAAGLSAGIIGHYFGGKNALLAATMRSLLSELQDVSIARLRRAGSPEQRIEAILSASFAREQFTAPVCAAWLAFYGQVPYAPELARLHRIYVRRLHSNLLHAFGQVLPRADAERAADGMSSMIDGIYVRAALNREALDLDQAWAIAHGYLDMLLGRPAAAGVSGESRRHVS